MVGFWVAVALRTADRFLRIIVEPGLYSGGIPVRLRYYPGIVLHVYIEVI